MIGPLVRTKMWQALRHFATDDDLGCLARLLPPDTLPDRAAIDALYGELTSSPELLAAVDSAAARAFDDAPGVAKSRLTRQIGLEGSGRGRTLLLYVIARVIKPEIVVETGCFTGWDSAVLLQALDRNGAGHLYSIDVPAREGQFSQYGVNSGLPDGLSPGFLVPAVFRERWTLIEGNVRQELMPLLDRVGDVGLFLHDSDHSYAHMMWEYAAVLPHMRDGGIVVSDDIAWNTAFWDFASAIGRRAVVHRSNANVGAIAIGKAA